MQIVTFQRGNRLYAVAVKAVSLAMDEWDESKHPRAENGQFGKGNGNNKGNPMSEQEFFGKSFKEFSGNPKGAIEKLMTEKQGYVPAAITKEGIGDIDLVYGKGGITGYGLAHIAEKHGEDIVNKLPDLIKNGTIDNSQAHLGRSFVYSEDKKVVISLTYLNSEHIWLLTAYDIDK